MIEFDIKLLEPELQLRHVKGLQLYVDTRIS